MTRRSNVSLPGAKPLCCILLSWSQYITRDSRTWANTLPGTDSKLVVTVMSAELTPPRITRGHYGPVSQACQRTGTGDLARRQTWLRTAEGDFRSFSLSLASAYWRAQNRTACLTRARGNVYVDDKLQMMMMRERSAYTHHNSNRYPTSLHGKQTYIRLGNKPLRSV